MKISEIQVSYKSRINDTIYAKDSKNAHKLLLASWDKNLIELQEEFKILLLNRASMVLGIYSLSKGGTASTIVDAKLVFSVALKTNASSLILAHNHPSGNTNPSQNDIILTKKLVSASKLLDIQILDHLIITLNGYESLADSNLVVF